MAKKKDKNFKYVYRTHLAKFRENAGMSQTKVALALKMTPSDYCLIENGKKGFLMNSRTIVRICEVLNVDVRTFVFAEKAYLDEVDRVNGIKRYE